MGNLIDFQTGSEITTEPSLYKISIEFPADKYSIEDIERLAENLHTVLANSKIFHSEPEITNVYEQFDGVSTI